MQAWQAESVVEARNEHAWSAPAQPSTHQWKMHNSAPQQSGNGDGGQSIAWPLTQEAGERQQSNAVPSAVQQRAAQYAGDEGLARPPTRPPSDWRSRQQQSHGDEAFVTASEQPSQSFDRCAQRHASSCEDSKQIQTASAELENCEHCASLYIRAGKMHDLPLSCTSQG